jgi:hypothetical protein
MSSSTSLITVSFRFIDEVNTRADLSSNVIFSVSFLFMKFILELIIKKKSI